MQQQNTQPEQAKLLTEDEYLFGWNPTPGIVAVWASRRGEALIWRREGERVLCYADRFTPWLLTTSLEDLAHLGRQLREAGAAWPAPPAGSILYRELDGPPGTYRFLLLAADLSQLERELLRGAARRLGYRPASIAELQTCYVVGPVEQYLMQTGQVYFRGLAYEELHRLQLDLETTALDPHRGRIFLAAVRDTRGLAITLEAPQPEDEARLIQDLCVLICERDPDVIENHNLFGFDLPFLEERARALALPLEIGRSGPAGGPQPPRRLLRYQETLAVGPEARRRTRYSLAGRELIDTLDAVRRHDFVVRDMPGYNLKEVARYFGIASADRTYIAGLDIFETYSRDPERVRRYALDDVAEVDGLSRRLLGAPFALASMAPRRYERLASAGPAMGVLEPIMVRSYLRASAALPRPTDEQGNRETLYEGGAAHLFATGVAEHVVKADVASLYPSLMRTFQIGPAGDRLGVLLSILGRLTDLRLQHKEAARRAAPGSVEANRHGATQAAMKILINAAYGYMGAGAMALFADARAAGEVTRRGRAILEQVEAALRRRGLALIESDTDGVYFAVPPGWDEAEERALVAAIAAELPPGIRLEYEGRYRAMFSHEVKNYALLTYDGQLIVHGVALRSSRAEPFGERFLRRALLATMLGKVQEVRAAYLETVAALRARALPAAEVATQVRLTRTPEAYLATRHSRPEPAYEALLRAGRRQWYPGERVRFYRTAEKTYVWLPDENEEAPAGWDWWAAPESARPGEQQLRPPAQPERATGGLSARYRELAGRRDYDVEYYIRLLTSSYAARLRKAFAPEDFALLFREDRQLTLFEETKSLEHIQPRWIRCPTENAVAESAS